MAQAFNLALAKLARAACFSKELYQYLLKKEVDPQEAQKAIDKLIEMGMLDDKERSERFVAMRAAKGYGMRRILMELKEKSGLSDSAFSKPVLSLEKYKKRNLKDPKERQKVIQSLLRKGFDFEEIQSAFLKIKVEEIKEYSLE